MPVRPPNDPAVPDCVWAAVPRNDNGFSDRLIKPKHGFRRRAKEGVDQCELDLRRFSRALRVALAICAIGSDREKAQGSLTRPWTGQAYHLRDEPTV